MAKQVLKLRGCCLNAAGLTPGQSSAITNAVGDDNSNLHHLKINCGSNTLTQLIFAVGNYIYQRIEYRYMAIVNYSYALMSRKIK